MNMKCFKGTHEDFSDILISLDIKGQWYDISNGFQFKTIDGATLNWFNKTGTIQYQGKEEPKLKLQNKLSSYNSDMIRPKAITLTRGQQNVEDVSISKIFVVHGHDINSRDQLELTLHKLGLEPFVLANTGGKGLTIIEALEEEISNKSTCAKFGIVLLTPDDFGYSKNDGMDKTEPRARQNVVLEMGMLIAALGRKNVAILKKGHLEVPSDASGILYIPFNEHVKETVPKLVDRLQHAGIKVNPENIIKATS